MSSTLSFSILANRHMISLLGFRELRTSVIVAPNIDDVDLTESRIWITEKGYQGQTQKAMLLLQVMCQLLAKYIDNLHQQQGPLFISKRNTRLSRGSLQSIFQQVTQKLGIDKKLHPHLFFHTAATHLKLATNWNL